MNGVHDMGGMHGLGPVQYERNEPVFHAHWEGRAFAINLAAAAWRKWSLDALRHQIELIPAADYLRMSYYEKWLTAVTERLVESGLGRVRSCLVRADRGKSRSSGSAGRHYRGVVNLLGAHLVVILRVRHDVLLKERRIPLHVALGLNVGRLGLVYAA